MSELIIDKIVGFTLRNMVCGKCGHTVKEPSIYCNICGSELPVMLRGYKDETKI